MERAPFFLFTPSVFLAAVVGGLGPGVFATFLGSLAVELVLIAQQGQPGSPEIARLSMFVVVGTGISVLAGSQRDARALAEDRERVANERADQLAIAQGAAEHNAREAERLAAEQRFVAEASRVLSASLDYEETLRRVVALAVPGMADWVALDIADDRGRVTRLVSAHRDAGADAGLDGHPPLHRLDASPRRASLLDVALRPRLMPRVTAEEMRELGVSDAQIEGLSPGRVASALAVPIELHGAIVGALAWMRGFARPAFDERDLAQAEEVARRAAMAVEHAQLYRQAQSASRMKDEFVATLSHELRTPLNALLGWIELLRSGRLSHERQQEAVDAIHRTATAQAQLTNDLVDVSRAVSGKFKLEPREVQVGELVPATTDVFRLAAESKGLWLRCQLDEPLPRLLADPDRLQQIVYNLVGNAVKFTARGGVDVGAHVDTDWLELTVRDTGIGIDPEFLPYVFDRFRQADGRVTREFGGLGLGLSIVRSLVELHGGTVAAASDGLGRGSTFTVRLPLAPPAPRRAVDGATISV
jgi:signal transduction histidine kinase